MKLLTKKSELNPNGLIESKDLLSDIENQISSLEVKLEDLKKENSELKKGINISRTKLIELLSDKFGVKLANINITGSPSIEKNSEIKDGTLYYNTRKKCFRGKVDGKWISFKKDLK